MSLRHKRTSRTSSGKPPGYEKHYTVHDLASFLGVSDRTVERWHSKGKIPQPDHVTGTGWKLWSTEQVTEIFHGGLAENLRKRKK